MGKAAQKLAANERSASHYVLYANGFPVHSSDSQEECELEKVNVAQEHRKSGKPFPQFHVVRRDIHDGEVVSHDEIESGDEKNPPSGLTKVRGL